MSADEPEQHESPAPGEELEVSITQQVVELVYERISESMPGTSGEINQILSSLTPQHFSELIASDREGNRKDHDRQVEETRWKYGFAIGVLVLIGVICLMFLVYQKADLLQPIITLLVGAGGGFGIGRATSSRPAK